MTNGIGAYWFPKWLVNWLNKHCEFALLAAQNHDAAYRGKYRSRYAIDRAFLLQCLTDARGDKEITISILFWFLVRVFGGISWRKNDDGNRRL